MHVSIQQFLPFGKEENAAAVLQTPSYRANAQKIRESFRRCGGAKAAAEKILSVADRK